MITHFACSHNLCLASSSVIVLAPWPRIIFKLIVLAQSQICNEEIYWHEIDGYPLCKSVEDYIKRFLLDFLSKFILITWDIFDIDYVDFFFCGGFQNTRPFSVSWAEYWKSCRIEKHPQKKKIEPTWLKMGSEKKDELEDWRKEENFRKRIQVAQKNSVFSPLKKFQTFLSLSSVIKYNLF